MGQTTFSGPVVSPGGFIGPVTSGSTPSATTTVAGTVLAAASQPAAAGANPTKAEYDALIAALKASGAMAT